MNAQNLLTTIQIWVGHRNLAVKATRAQQCGVQNVRTVRCGHQDHAFAITKSVHLHEQLVEGLFTLIVTAAHARATLATHCIDLIHEDDARRVLLRLLEQIAHARGTHADEHLDEV